MVDAATTGSGADGARAFALLAALGCWTIAVPYLGPLLGLKLDVAGITEVVDHVIPGALVVAAALLALARREHETLVLACTALAFLAAFWVTSTHVPLIAEAARGESPWGAAIWHNSAGLPPAALTLWLLVRPLVSAREPA